MSKLVKIILGVVGVFVSAIIAIYFFTANIVTSADEFFTSIKNKDTNKAYTYLSEDFQANTSQLDLEVYLEKSLMNNFKSANWGISFY